MKKYYSPPDVFYNPEELFFGKNQEKPRTVNTGFRVESEECLKNSSGSPRPRKMQENFLKGEEKIEVLSPHLRPPPQDTGKRPQVAESKCFLIIRASPARYS